MHRSARRPPCGSRHRPIASKFSSANPSGSICAWQLAHAGFARCSPWRSASAAARPSQFFSSRAARSAAAAAAARRAGSPESTCPRITGDVRVGYDVTRQHAALPEQSAPRLVGHRHPPEVRSRRCSGCRNGGPAARSRTCSPRSADPAALRSSRRCCRTAARFPAGCRRRPRRNPGRRAVALDRFEIAQLQPLAGEICDQRIGLRRSPASRAPAARSSAGSLSRPRSAASSSSSSGIVLHRKNDSREARSRSLTRYGVLGATFAGSSSMRNRNDGLTSMRSIARCMPVSNPPSVRPAS